MRNLKNNIAKSTIDEGLMLAPEVRKEVMRAVATGAEPLTIKAAEVDATRLANEVVDRLEETIVSQGGAQ